MESEALDFAPVRPMFADGLTIAKSPSFQPGSALHHCKPLVGFSDYEIHDNFHNLEHLLDLLAHRFALAPSVSNSDHLLYSSPRL